MTGQIYDSGYTNNSRTVTVNTKNVFELVNDSSLEEITDNSVLLEINNTDSDVQSQDVYVIGGTYNNDNIVLSRNDSASINVDVSAITGWYDGR